MTSCELQQYLPFTVLKRYSAERERYTQELQQYLPFTVLKLKPSSCCLNKQPLQQYLPFTVLKPILIGKERYLW